MFEKTADLSDAVTLGVKAFKLDKTPIGQQVLRVTKATSVGARVMKYLLTPDEVKFWDVINENLKGKKKVFSATELH